MKAALCGTQSERRMVRRSSSAPGTTTSVMRVSLESIDVGKGNRLVAATSIDLRPERDLVIDPGLAHDLSLLDQEVGHAENVGALARQWPEVGLAVVRADQHPADRDPQPGVVDGVVGLNVADLELSTREGPEQPEQGTPVALRTDPGAVADVVEEEVPWHVPGDLVQITV